MREADRRECWALNRTPREALRLGLRVGVDTMTAVGPSGPIAMFGILPVSALTGEAQPWFLGTSEVLNYPRELLCIGRRIIAYWRQEYACLSNFVSADNAPAINLLRHWGFEIGTDERLIRDVRFVRFHFPAIQAEQAAA